MSRTVEEQHEMLLHALDSVKDAGAIADPDARSSATVAALRNQEVQALTLIAMELTSIRKALEDPLIAVAQASSLNQAIEILRRDID